MATLHLRATVGETFLMACLDTLEDPLEETSSLVVVDRLQGDFVRADPDSGNNKCFVEKSIAILPDSTDPVRIMALLSTSTWTADVYLMGKFAGD